MSGALSGKPEIVGYDAVRRAARDVATYSSDLQGDADVRTYRQLPLEVDPPRHTQLRQLLAPYFSREHVEGKRIEFRRTAGRLIGSLSDGDPFEVGRDLSLPYVMGCLGAIYDRPQDVDEWTSWGPVVWLADAYMRGEPVSAETHRAQRERDYSLPTQRSGATLESYLHRVLDEAVDRAVPARGPADIWQFLVMAEIDGRRLSRDEMLGIGNVLLAGGRDTVVKLVTGAVWHLIRTPEDREYLAAGPPARRTQAIHELARYLSPLPKIERLRKERSGTGERVLLNWASANHDATVFPDPDRLDLRRPPTPDVAFGSGRHSCLGLHITRVEMLALLDALLHPWPGWRFAAEPVIEWREERSGDVAFTLLSAFRSVRVTATARQRT